MTIHLKDGREIQSAYQDPRRRRPRTDAEKRRMSEAMKRAWAKKKAERDGE